MIILFMIIYHYCLFTQLTTHNSALLLLEKEKIIYSNIYKSAVIIGQLFFLFILDGNVVISSSSSYKCMLSDIRGLYYIIYNYLPLSFTQHTTHNSALLLLEKEKIIYFNTYKECSNNRAIVLGNVVM